MSFELVTRSGFPDVTGEKAAEHHMTPHLQEQVSSQLAGWKTTKGAPTSSALPVEFKEGISYPVGSVVNVPLDRIVENPLNPRVFFHEEELNSLAQSLKVRGQLETAKAFYDLESETFKLLNGHRRFRALSTLEAKHLRVEVVEDKKELEAFFESRDINLEAKEHTFLDDSVRFQEIMEQFDLNQRQLSLELGMPEADISKRLRIGVLPREVLEFIATSDADIGLDSCYRIAMLFDNATKQSNSNPDPLDQEKALELTYKIVELFIDGKMTFRKMRALKFLTDVEKEAKSANEVKRRASVLRRMAVSSKSSPDTSGYLRVFPEKVQLVVSGLSESDREALSVKIMKLLKESGLSEK